MTVLAAGAARLNLLGELPATAILFVSTDLAFAGAITTGYTWFCRPGPRALSAVALASVSFLPLALAASRSADSWSRSVIITPASVVTFIVVALAVTLTALRALGRAALAAADWTRARSGRAPLSAVATRWCEDASADERLAAQLLAASTMWLAVRWVFNVGDEPDSAVGQALQAVVDYAEPLASGIATGAIVWAGILLATKRAQRRDESQE